MVDRTRPRCSAWPTRPRHSWCWSATARSRPSVGGVPDLAIRYAPGRVQQLTACAASDPRCAELSLQMRAVLRRAVKTNSSPRRDVIPRQRRSSVASTGR
jgi:hypothetical protein